MHASLQLQVIVFRTKLIINRLRYLSRMENANPRDPPNVKIP